MPYDVTRHRWVKLKTHVYVCAKCGTGKRNVLGRGVAWFQKWYLPNGTAIVDSHTPPCAVGVYTDERLRKCASAIACSDDTRARVVNERT